MKIGFVLAVVLALAACRSSGESPAPSTGLALYIQGKLVRQETAAELAKRPTNYAQGGVRGWTVFGSIAPRNASRLVQRLEVVGHDGARLVVEQPRIRYAGWKPVLVVDRGGGLRFTMVALDGADAAADGRGPGDRSGVGDPQRAGAPLALDGVTEIRLTYGSPPQRASTAAGAVPRERPGDGPGSGKGLGPGRGGSGPGSGGGREARGGGPGGSGMRPDGAAAQMKLVVGDRTETLGVEAIRKESPAGEGWPLRDLVRRRSTRPVREVTIRPREGQALRIDRAAWESTAPITLRLNRRGLLKLEAHAGDVRDVVEIDVVLE